MSPGTHPTTVVRRIAADPTGTALLLAGPAALELWPAGMCVRAEPPHRTPSSYITRFSWSGPGLPATSAELTLAFATGHDGRLATDAQLVLEEPSLQNIARGFLDNLASAAELRSHAA